jgi:hypothetical protein
VGDEMQIVMLDFKNWCGMLSVMRVINGNHICITKPTSVLLKEYYYNKKKVCNMIVHAMVDN